MKQVAETYQVFINHMGADVRLSLASLIYHRLKSCGLRVFLDTEELRTGDSLCPAIREAICSASAHIAIFSENYAESRCCLDELCLILKSSNRRTIIPVFCDVEPHDLRYVHKGRYAESFRKHERKGSVPMEVMEGWKTALREAADIAGLLFRKNESDHGKFLESVVENVLRVVKWEPLEVATYPVGVDEALEDLQTEILKQSTPKVVGIAGIGGIGKSTLAKHVFNSTSSKFSRCCYLSNVRGREKYELAFLQRQLFCDLLGNDMNIANSDLGKTILRNSLRGLKLLLVVDDVDDKEKLKSLLDIDAVEPGSLILITSRDKNIMTGFSANTLLYDVKPLDTKHSRKLFCRHAFGQAEPIEGYYDFVEEFLKICEGWPLGLKVLGEQLAVKLDRTYWKRQLDMFSQGLPLPEVDTAINTLKWSYQAMEIEEKEMLLDVGCFLVGENVELAVRVLEGLGYYINVQTCLESLRQKCLLDFTIDVESHFNSGSGARGQDILTPQGRHVILPTVLPRTSSKIIMQNQVRELARHIVREDFRSRDKRPLRLSCATDMVKMLQSHAGSDFCCIRGIRIPGGRDPPRLPDNINVKGLRLLVVDSLEFSSFLGSGISGDLVWLRWRYSLIVPLPSTISVKSLRILELQGPMDDLEKLFIRFDNIPEQLRDLNIDAMEEGTTPSPSSTSQPVDLPHWMDGKISTTLLMPSFYSFLERVGTLMTNLMKIVLKNLTFLQILPIDFSELSNLRHLDLSGSSNLTELPTSFSQLLQLRHLTLRDCENLSIPTDLFGQISTLEYIDFKGCAQLSELPHGIASQRHLRYLNLLYTHLQALPLNLELLDKLEQLRIGSEHLTKIPGSVASLKGLKELILFGCNTLDDITPIETLILVERLEIYSSAVQTTMPQGIVGLTNIKILVIDSCPIVELSFHRRGYLPADYVMQSLRDFTLTHTSISCICIPEIVCPRLEIVDLSYNFQLMEVEVLPSTLVRLNLEGCSGLKTLTNLSNLVSLKFLNIDGCVILETVNVQGLTSLEEISAAKCWKLQSIEASSKLEGLNFLCVSRDLHGIYSNTLTIETAMQFIVNSFGDLSVLDVPASTSNKSPVWLNNVHSHCAILMFFITYRFSRNGFCVSFEPSNNDAPYEEYNTVCGDGSGGSRLHIYMWTEDSKLFKDDNFYNEASVYHDNLYSVGNKKPAIYHDNIYYKLEGEKGWILTFATKTQAFEVCRQIMLRVS